MLIHIGGFHDFNFNSYWEDPKTEVLYHIRPYVGGIFPEMAEKMGQKYMIGTSNQSVPESWPVINRSSNTRVPRVPKGRRLLCETRSSPAWLETLCWDSASLKKLVEKTFEHFSRMNAAWRFIGVCLTLMENTGCLENRQGWKSNVWRWVEIQPLHWRVYESHLISSN